MTSPESEPSTFTVPIVDISPFVGDGTPEERRKVVADIDNACATVGFIQIVGHGIPTDVIDGLTSAMDDFFDLELATKKGYLVEGANRGYTAPKSESLSLSAGVESASRMNDFFEAYNIGVEARSFDTLDLDEADYGINVWPRVDGYRERIETYFSEARRVARTLTTIFAEALGESPDFFDTITDHSIDVLRMNNYALPPGTDVKLDEDLTGMGEHTDFGFVTVLWADQVRGLQVLDTNGGWNDVSPIDGALLVNLGDLTARLTNDRWMSTLHRVKPPVIDGTIERRRSAALFHDGNADAVVATLPSHLDYDNGMAYEPITVTDHVAHKLAGSRGGKLNVAAVREAQRVLSATDK